MAQFEAQADKAAASSKAAKEAKSKEMCIRDSIKGFKGKKGVAFDASVTFDAGFTLTLSLSLIHI